MVEYKDFLLSFTFVSLGSMSFHVSHLGTDFIRAWSGLAGSKHKHIMPLGLGTVIKLLHISAISSPNAASLDSLVVFLVLSKMAPWVHMLCALVTPGMALHHP